jgi:hypothetical protein
MRQVGPRDSTIRWGTCGVPRLLALAVLAIAGPPSALAWQGTPLPSQAPALAGELSGTWRGMMSTGEQSTDSQFTFSDDGYLVLEYTNNQGVTRAAELSEVGQRVQYVPDGGGVRTIEVVALEKSPGRLAMRLRNSFERSSGGYMDQRYTDEVLVFELTSEGLQAEMQLSTFSGFGDRSMSVSGEDSTVERGVLQRVE